MFLISNLRARQKTKQLDAQKQLSAERTNTLSRFEGALKDAALIDNPVEKITRLKSIERDIGAEVSRTYMGIGRKAGRKGTFAATKTALATLAVTTGIIVCAGAMAPMSMAAAFVITMVALIGVPGAGVAIGAYALNKARASAYKLLTQDAQEFLGTLNGKKNTVSALADQAVVDNVNVIAATPAPERERLLALPGIKDKFAAAAAEKLVANDNATASKVPATANSKPSL